MLVSESFKPFEIYMTAGAIYLVLSLASSWPVSVLEQRLHPLEQAFTGRDMPCDRPGRRNVSPCSGTGRQLRRRPAAPFVAFRPYQAP
jgi:hypothetical protein